MNIISGASSASIELAGALVHVGAGAAAATTTGVEPVAGAAALARVGALVRPAAAAPTALAVDVAVRGAAHGGEDYAPSKASAEEGRGQHVHQISKGLATRRAPDCAENPARWIRAGEHAIQEKLTPVVD